MIFKIQRHLGDDVRNLTSILPFLSVLLLTSSSSFAVQQAWVVKYSSGPGSTNPPVAIAVGQDGDIYVAGTSTQSNAPYNLDYVIIKYSPTGTELWVNRFGSPGANETARAMVTGINGDVFVTGTGGTVKYHASGLLAWSAPYAGSDVKVDANGNAYVTGFRTDAYSVVKIAPNGTNIWLRLWDPSQWEDSSHKIALDSVGNLFLVGFVTFTCDRLGCYRRLWAAKYDATGEFLWSSLVFEGYYNNQSEYKGALCDRRGHLYLAMDLIQYPAGSRYPWANHQITSNGMHGWSYDLNDTFFPPGVRAITSDSIGHLYYTGVNSKIGALEAHKLTTDGTNVWTAQYLPSLGLHFGNAISIDTAGNACVTGQSPGAGTGNDYVTIKYGTNGQQLWVKRYTEAGNSDDQAHAIAVGPNGDVYVTGFSNPSPGTYEITTIKYVQLAPIEKKSNGNILLSFCGTPGSNYVIEACTTLTNWTNIATIAASPTGLYTFEDTNAPLHQQRFYRTKQE